MNNLNKILTKQFLEQKYLAEGLSTPQVAKLLGCGDVTVLKYLKKYDIPRRTKSEALKGKFIGKNSSMYGKHHSEQTRKKMSEAKKDKKRSKETKKKISETCKRLGLARDENNPNWKGGKFKDGSGYILILSPNHPHKIERNYVFEHRLVVENVLGQYLNPKWVVHHINGVRDDNGGGNLMGFVSNSAHLRFHKNPNNVKPKEIIFDGRKI